MSEQTRSMWRCGWMPEAERRPRSTRRDPQRWECAPEDLCPGYLVCLPQVREAAGAHVWWKEGQLDLVYKDVADNDLLKWAIGQLNQSQGEAEAEAQAKING